MTPELQHLIHVYGYWLMAFGAIIEGETFLVAGGVAAQHGMLHLPGLILLALVGSFVHDCFFFFLGRFAGHKILQNWPKLEKKSQYVLRLFEKYGVWLIIALRYAYGLRTMIPTILGMSNISVRTFIIFDLIGGLLWSCTFILAGYFLGEAIDRILKSIGVYEHLAGYIFIILVAAVFGFGLLWWIMKKVRAGRRGR